MPCIPWRLLHNKSFTILGNTYPYPIAKKLGWAAAGLDSCWFQWASPLFVGLVSSPGYPTSSLQAGRPGWDAGLFADCSTMRHIVGATGLHSTSSRSSDSTYSFKMMCTACVMFTATALLLSSATIENCIWSDLSKSQRRNGECFVISSVVRSLISRFDNRLLAYSSVSLVTYVLCCWLLRYTLLWLGLRYLISHHSG